MQLEQTENGNELVFTVTDVAEGKVVLDGNHPLAGMAWCLKHGDQCPSCQ